MTKPTVPSPKPRRKPRRWLALLVLFLGAMLVVVFGLRTWHQLEFSQRVERGEIQVQTLRGWMTLPYIAQTYGVPQAELRAAIHAPATGNDDRSLRVWFKLTGTDPATGRQAIEALILAYREPTGQTAP